MEAFLDNIPRPEQLLELYASLFSRFTGIDTENQKLTKTALEILAVARRPLSVLELAWAVAMGVSPEAVSTIAALALLVDHQRLLSPIQPFIARVDLNDMNKRQVQLVQKSARDIVIRGWYTASSYSLDPTATSESCFGQRVAKLEAALLNICVRYLLLDDIDQRELFSSEQLAVEELLDDFDLFDENKEPADYDPNCSWEEWEKDMRHYDPAELGFGEFFVYASCHWVDHFGAIKTKPPPGSIETLCKKGTKRLQNWINQNCRPGCTIKPRFTFDSSLYGPLAITSLYGSHIAFQHMLENADFGSSDFFTNTAMKAADQIFQWGDLSWISTMFTQSAIGRQLWNVNFFQLVIKYWSVSKKQSQGQDWDVVFELVGCVLDNMVQDSWGNEILCLASGSGCMPIVRRLMDAA